MQVRSAGVCSTSYNCSTARPLRRLARPARASTEGSSGDQNVQVKTSDPPAAPSAGSKDALLARIAKAKAYKSGGAAPAGAGPAAPAPAPPPSLSPGGLPQRPATTDWGAMAAFLESGGKAQGSKEDSWKPNPAAPVDVSDAAQAAEAEAQRKARFEAAKNKMSDDFESPDDEVVSVIMSATQAPGRGSASRAAPFLQSVLDEKSEVNMLTDGLDASTMRAEEYTAAREQRLRGMGVEILTVDSTYRPDIGITDSDGNLLEGPIGIITATTRVADAAANLLGPQAPTTTEAPPSTEPSEDDGSASKEDKGASEGQTYAPKVSTWGVFPRPADISAAYGGGRDIKPGQALETPEQKAAREAAYTEALKAYRAKVGLEVDKDAEEEAEVLYNEGMAILSDKKDLRGAYDRFDDALKLVPIKSRIGGLAGIQKAIILDSQGYPEEAQKLYKKLQGHAVTAVSRKAKQMLFGFQAAAFLKADTISYSAKKGDFDRYFRGIVDRNKIWVATKEDKEADERMQRLAALIAVAVLLGPIGLVATLALKSGAVHLF